VLWGDADRVLRTSEYNAVDLGAIFSLASSVVDPAAAAAAAAAGL
jgi:hypothetical protein